MRTTTNIHAGAIPPGSYQATCKNIGFSEQSRSLDAECLKMNGAWDPDAIIVPVGYTGDIANCDGALTLGACSIRNGGGGGKIP